MPGLVECGQYYLDTRLSFRHTLPAKKKVLFKSQNLDEKTVRLITKARNLLNEWKEDNTCV